MTTVTLLTALREPEAVARALRDHADPRLLVALVATAAAGVGAYGAAMHASGGALAMLRAGALATLAAGLAWSATLPSLHILGSLTGSRVRWRALLLASLITVSFGGLAMFASIPVLWFFELCVPHRLMRIAINLVVFAGVGLSMADVFARGDGDAGGPARPPPRLAVPAGPRRLRTLLRRRPVRPLARAPARLPTPSPGVPMSATTTASSVAATPAPAGTTPSPLRPAHHRARGRPPALRPARARRSAPAGAGPHLLRRPRDLRARPRRAAARGRLEPLERGPGPGTHGQPGWGPWWPPTASASSAPRWSACRRPTSTPLLAGGEDPRLAHRGGGHARPGHLRGGADGPAARLPRHRAGGGADHPGQPRAQPPQGAGGGHGWLHPALRGRPRRHEPPGPQLPPDGGGEPRPQGHHPPGSRRQHRRVRPPNRHTRSTRRRRARARARPPRPRLDLSLRPHGPPRGCGGSSPCSPPDPLASWPPESPCAPSSSPSSTCWSASPPPPPGAAASAGARPPLCWCCGPCSCPPSSPPPPLPRRSARVAPGRRASTPPWRRWARPWVPGMTCLTAPCSNRRSARPARGLAALATRLAQLDAVVAPARVRPARPGRRGRRARCRRPPAESPGQRAPARGPPRRRAAAARGGAGRPPGPHHPGAPGALHPPRRPGPGRAARSAWPGPSTAPPS